MDEIIYRKLICPGLHHQGQNILRQTYAFSTLYIVLFIDSSYLPELPNSNRTDDDSNANWITNLYCAH